MRSVYQLRRKGGMFDLTAVLPQGIIKKRANGTSGLYRRNLALVGLVLFFGAGYLFEVNVLSTKGYEIKVQERKLKNLEVEQKHLEIQASNLQSISRIRHVAATANLVPVSNVIYINDSDFALK